MSFSKEIGASMEHLRCNRAPGSHPSKPDAGSVYSRPTNPNQEGSPAGQVHGIAGAVFPFPGQGIMSAQTGGVFSESLSQYSEGHYPHHGVSDHFTPLVQAVAEGAPNYAPWYYDDRMTPYAPQGMPRSEYPDNVLSEHEDFPSMLELSRGHPSPPRENIPSFQSTSSESELASKHNEAGINLYLAAPASSSSQKQARGTPQQLVWDPRSDTQAPVGPLKRPRTQEARSQTRHIRSRGGACAFCRKNRRRVCISTLPPIAWPVLFPPFWFHGQGLSECVYDVVLSGSPTGWSHKE
jgi:hypothetical protein